MLLASALSLTLLLNFTAIWANDRIQILELDQLLKNSQLINLDNLSASNKNLSNLLPPLWDDIPELTSTNFDVNTDGSLVVDVWDYLERMALYKHLITNVHNCAWETNEHSLKFSQNLIDSLTVEESGSTVQELFKDLDPGNILWGLPLQHGWQFSSGRLFTAENSTKIDPSAWWADMNYFLSVIPYFGAVEAGIAPSIVLRCDVDERFCSSPSDCPDIVQPWNEFFVLVTESRDQCSDNTKDFSNTPVASRADFNLTENLETLLFSLWNAHLNSIGTALPLFEEELNLLAQPELVFGRSWAGIVDFIAACNFNCNILITNVLQNLLPPRILTDDDQVPKIDDISRLQNRALLFIDGLYAWNASTDGRTQATWNYVMCTEPGRALGREMITLGVYRPVVMIQDIPKLYDIAQNQSGDCFKGK